MSRRKKPSQPNWEEADLADMELVKFASNPSPSLTATQAAMQKAYLEALKTAEPQKVQKRMPDYVCVLTGWRGWRVIGQNLLQALGQNEIWEPKKQIEARCIKNYGLRPRQMFTALGGVLSNKSKPVHDAPGFDCNCGIWAFKDLDCLVATIGSQYTEVAVIGQVSLWGRVIETTNGWRAQYAYPSELWLLDNSLEELGYIYDVPVRMASC